MKCYNVQNYIRYKKDIKQIVKRTDFCRPWDEMTRDELITSFLPLSENLARKFSTTQQASGVMTINDLIQEGNKNLTIAVDKIVWDTIYEAEDPEQRLKSFLSKRIKGGIRRAVDINRGTMRIPEHKLIEIRKNDEDREQIELFFNSVFASLDAMLDDANISFEIPDKIKNYNPELLCSYLLGLLNQHLSEREADVIRFSFGLNCDKLSAKQIAAKLDIKGDSAYVRVSQLKKQAIDKLTENVDYSQVIDFL
jgi:RNA polymerase sigma factor (sigma-70 family)